MNQGKQPATQGVRILAQELETLVIHQAIDWLNDTDALLTELNPEPEQIQNLIAHAIQLAIDLQHHQHAQFHLLRQVIVRVDVGNTYVSISIKASALIVTELEDTDKQIVLKTNMELKRCGYAMRLIITDNNKNKTLKNQHIIHYLSKAYQCLSLTTSGKVQSI